jgi:hypothetical protein
MRVEKPEIPASDTSPEAESIQIDLLRKTPTWKRLRVAAEMSETVMILSRIGVTRRNPRATSAELQHLAGEVILGPELALRVYGR